MELEGKKVGFVLTGSFCTFSKVIPEIKNIISKGASVVPIMSFNAHNIDTRFGNAKDFIQEIEELCGKKIISTIEGAEPIGPKKWTDIMIACPCSGNTMAKLANAITDTGALMAMKSHLRNRLSFGYCCFYK